MGPGQGSVVLWSSVEPAKVVQSKYAFGNRTTVAGILVAHDNALMCDYDEGRAE